MTTSTEKRLRSAFGSATVRRPRDLAGHGINRVQLREAVAAGIVNRAGRGLYILPDADITEHHTFAEVGYTLKRVGGYEKSGMLMRQAGETTLVSIGQALEAAAA